MTNEIALRSSVKLYRLMGNPEWRDGEIIGDVHLDELSIPLIESMLSDHLIYPTAEFEGKQVSLSEVDLSNPPGRKARITLQPPRSHSVFFAKDLDEILESPKRKLEAPSQFFVAKLNYMSGESEVPAEVVKYRDALNLIELLEYVADYTERSEGRCVFVLIGADKFLLPVNYSAMDLKNVEQVRELSEFLKDKPHRDQKKIIFSSVIIEYLRNTPKDSRISHLMKNFPDVESKFKDNYELFVSEFSFDKVRAEVEKRSLDYTIRLNNVFADVQNKLLAIPLALVLVGSQVKPNEMTSAKNIAVLVGAMVFSILMIMLVRNQRDALEAIWSEIDQQQKVLRQKHSDIAAKFDSLFDGLKVRYDHQNTLLNVVGCVVWLGLAVSMATLLWLVPQGKWVLDAFFGAVSHWFVNLWAKVHG